MKNRFSTVLTILLVAVLLAGAVVIGGVKGYKEEREELLLSCMEMHTRAGSQLARSIGECEEQAEDFDARLKYQLMGKISSAFGVKPVSSNVKALHSQLLKEETITAESPDLLQQLGAQVSELLEDNIDTKISLSKVFWTIVCLFAIFGKKSRRKGFSLKTLLAGVGLFNIWKKK